MERHIISVDMGQALKNHVTEQAKQRGLSPSIFIREVLKKYTKFKEKKVL